MTKTGIIEFLQAQLADIKASDFDLEIFKSSVGNVLKLTFGDQSSYYKQVASLDYIQKNSLEELYPKKINDVAGTASKAAQITKGLIQQFELLDEKGFKLIKNIKVETVTNIKTALQNHLTGSQISLLKLFIAENKDTGLVVEQLRQLDSEAVLRILAEILSDKDIWID